MRYRALGKTGLKVSEIGMGCEGLLEDNCGMAAKLLDEAQALGVNCIDLYSSNPALRSALGAALKGRRDAFLLQAHLCSAWKNGQYKRTRDLQETQEAFEDLLTRLGTDSVEIGMIHYSDALDDWREIEQGPILRYAKELKAAGKIGHIGLSSHNPEVALEAVKSGSIEVLMFSVNPLYDLLPGSEDCQDLWRDESYIAPLLNIDPEREALYETCERLGVGITVMKAFGGGDLLSDSLSPAGRALTSAQLIHYALTRPAVATVLAGAHSAQQLQDSTRYEDASEEEKDYAAALAGLPAASWRGRCMYCGHCAPCPAGIDIATVTKFLNLSIAQGDAPETVREHYALLSRTAADCVQCGACEARCPFKVPVRENMRFAQMLFGM